MAIEPVGTMTAMQVQTSVKVTPHTQTTEAESVDYSASQVTATPKLDETTAMVSKSFESNTQDNGSEQQTSDNETIRKAVEDMNKKMSNAEAVYGIHEGTNRVTIKIIDKKTKELIKELPPEKTLDMIARVWEMAGILVDEKR